MDFPTCHYSWLFRQTLWNVIWMLVFSLSPVKLRCQQWQRCFCRNGIDFKNTSGVPKCCPILENDDFLLSVMKMWVTRCTFLRSSTFYHVNLEKSQASCLDMRFTKVSIKWVNKVFKLDVPFFHQKYLSHNSTFLPWSSWSQISV